MADKASSVEVGVFLSPRSVHLYVIVLGMSVVKAAVG